jgi:membrane protease YdiL (CAAX protease family)
VVKTSTSARSPLSPTLYPPEAFPWYGSLGVVLVLFVVTILSSAFFIGIAYVFHFATIEELKRLSWPTIVVQIWSYAITLAVLFGILPALAKRPLGELGLRAPRLSDVAWGLGGAVAMIVFAALTGALQDALFHLKPDEVQVHWLREARGSLVIAFAVLACVIAPVFEETVFRGFLFNALLRYVPAWAAAVLSAVVFGLAHLQSGNAGAIAPLVSGGIVLAAVYYRTGSLAASMTTHAAFNAFTVVLVVVFHQS